MMSLDPFNDAFLYMRGYDGKARISPSSYDQPPLPLTTLTLETMQHWH
jgi:hypothetical protein